MFAYDVTNFATQFKNVFSFRRKIYGYLLILFCFSNFCCQDSNFYRIFMLCTSVFACFEVLTMLLTEYLRTLYVVYWGRCPSLSCFYLLPCALLAYGGFSHGVKRGEDYLSNINRYRQCKGVWPILNIELSALTSLSPWSIPPRAIKLIEYVRCRCRNPSFQILYRTIRDHHTYVVLFRVAFIARVSSTYILNNPFLSQYPDVSWHKYKILCAHVKKTRYEKPSSIVKELFSGVMGTFYIAPNFYIETRRTLVYPFHHKQSIK